MLLSFNFFTYFIFQRLVDPGDQPCEGTVVDGFGQGISGIDSMIHSKWTQNLRAKKTERLPDRRVAALQNKLHT